MRLTDVVADVKLETETTDAGAAVTEGRFFLPKVTCFLVAALWADDFAVAALRADDFAVTSFSTRAFIGFFLAPVIALGGMKMRDERRWVMGKATTHPHPTLYSRIHLTIAIYCVRNQLGSKLIAKSSENA